MILTEINDFSFPFTMELFLVPVFSLTLPLKSSPGQILSNIFAEFAMRKCNIHPIKILGLFCFVFNGVGFHLCFSCCLRLVLSKPTRILIKIISTNSTA